MPDPQTLARLLDELAWTLRREGFDVAPSQAIDLGRAVAAVGLEDPWAVRQAIAIVVGPVPAARRRFDAILRSFFSADLLSTEGPRARRRLLDRLGDEQLTPDEIEAVRIALDELGESSPVEAAALMRFLDGPSDTAHAVLASGTLDAIEAGSELELGHMAHRLLRVAGADSARRAHARLRTLLERSLGARGLTLAQAIARELQLAHDSLRQLVRRRFDAKVEAQLVRSRRGGASVTPLALLDAKDADRVRRALRELALRLRASNAARVRRCKRALDPRRTLRASLRTGGVPFRLVRRRRPRPSSRLVVLCDVSDSVRFAAAFLLELVAGLKDLVGATRSFVFVSELGETTRVFAAARSRHQVSQAVAQAWAGAGVVSTADNSNYGRVLRAFERQHGRDLDRRTTVVILGDGRTNRHDPAADVIDRLRSRARAILWFCPEPRSQWLLGDSAMLAYAAKCTWTFEVGCAEDLERATRAMLRYARG
jgi:uncharacterized protein with von Willebrand factor type A (vWA) domain